MGESKRRKLFIKKTEEMEEYKEASCHDCGWTGDVSELIHTAPNNPEFDTSLCPSCGSNDKFEKILDKEMDRREDEF